MLAFPLVISLYCLLVYERAPPSARGSRRAREAGEKESRRAGEQRLGAETEPRVEAAPGQRLSGTQRSRLPICRLPGADVILTLGLLL